MDLTDKQTPGAPEMPELDVLPEDMKHEDVVTDAQEPSEIVDTPTPQVVSTPIVTEVNHTVLVKTKEVTKKPRRKLSKRGWLILLAVILTVAAGAGVWFWKHNQKPQVTDSKAPVTTTKKTETKQDNGPVISAEDKALLEKMIHPTTGETWYASPITLADQKFMAPLTQDAINNGVTQPIYKEVGKRAGNKIVLVQAAADGPGGDSYYLFEVAPNNTTRLISHPDGIAKYDDTYGPTADMFTKGIIIDTSTHYDSLTIPGAIDLGNGYAVKSTGNGSIADSFYSSQGSTSVKQIGDSAIVKIARSDTATGLTSYGYMMQFPFKTTVLLKYEPLETTLKDYKWQNGVSTSDTIAAIARGCGGLSAAVTVANNAKDADFVFAGTSSSGQKVYDAKDANYILVNKAYDEFHTFYNGSTDAAGKQKLAMTKADFIKQHGVVFYKDKSGAWLVYARQDFAAVGGCAKPVVYLYPTQAEQVNVRVGADVKVSIPLYNTTTGWSVWAQPNGQLTANGTAYDSLFWEGPGQGAYPSITSGSVVARSAAVDTIRQQLAQQGLNTKESNDFMAYWENKVPNKPYIRLTWFSTAQLNELAPLKITPAPDTLIRVFLDMDGLDKPISLPAQHLSTIPRNGFTVVEWGGLSLTKLY